jgi:hypothetical protein
MKTSILSPYRSSRSRSINVKWYILTFAMTYLICKVGQGYNFLLSPMLVSFGATGHLIVASGCGAGAPNVWTDVRTYVRRAPLYPPFRLSTTGDNNCVPSLFHFPVTWGLHCEAFPYLSSREEPGLYRVQGTEVAEAAVSGIRGQRCGGTDSPRHCSTQHQCDTRVCLHRYTKANKKYILGSEETPVWSQTPPHGPFYHSC